VSSFPLDIGSNLFDLFDNAREHHSPPLEEPLTDSTTPYQYPLRQLVVGWITSVSTQCSPSELLIQRKAKKDRKGLPSEQGGLSICERLTSPLVLSDIASRGTRGTERGNLPSSVRFKRIFGRTKYLDDDV